MTRARLLALLLLVVVALVPSLGGASSRLGVSPHNKPDGCVACHDPSVGASPGAVRPVLATCYSCHPDADMHPVGMVPRDINVAAGWPLENGKVTCATCHAEPSCDPAREKVPPYFRDGNPAQTRDLCYRCHVRVQVERSNPHVGGSATGSCSACHMTPPAVGASPAASQLRTQPAAACATCHTGPIHAGVAEHVGKKPPAPLAADVAASLPLAPDGTIACFTCHDVHAPGAETGPTPGIASRIAAAHAGGAPAGGTSLLALPLRDDRLCKACHGSGP